MLAWLKTILKKIAGIPEVKTCPICGGTGVNCFTCDEGGWPDPVQAQAVYAMGDGIEYIQCYLDKCCYCRGDGKVDKDLDLPGPLVRCFACNQAFGEVRAVPMWDDYEN